jgi:hypothetical protein
MLALALGMMEIVIIMAIVATFLLIFVVKSRG